jgi:hypothetical protein
MLFYDELKIISYLITRYFKILAYIQNQKNQIIFEILILLCMPF